MGRNSFLLYDRDGALLQLLDDEQAGKLLRALFDYRNGIRPEFSDRTTSVVFDIIKGHLDSDAEKYAAICERNRLAGRKGGEARANNCKRTQADVSTVKQIQADQAEDDDEYEDDMKKNISCSSGDERAPEKEKGKPDQSALEANFNAIYKIYPRKKDKAKAFKAYRAFVGPGKKINGKNYRLSNSQIWEAVSAFVAILPA